MKFEIRNYHITDLSSLYKICLLTAINGDGNWNAGIRNIEEEFCSKDEIKEAMVNFNQAVLNRIICSYGMSKF